MNSEVGPLSSASSPPRALPRKSPSHRLVALALAASALCHLLALIALLHASPEHRRGSRPRSREIIITLAPESWRPAPVTPPEAARPQEKPHPPVPAATPAAAPAPAHKPAAQPRQAPAASRTASPSPQVPQEVQEAEDVLGRIHDNWLEPPGAARSFRCRIHIDYAAGGMIVAVRFLQGCGSLVLDDSVRHAIWKTQPLPLRAAQEAGSLEIEFTP